ncbi:translation initiation factor 2 [Paractinoplanes durhamensis]|uniref:translation initiation factor 2 n=1 Tax=Paractinoplanes durhamensis TaxID=113563 RepID=UPI0036289885
MTDKYFPAAPGVSAGDAAASRVLWSGRCAVAEYAFEEPNSLPRWTLPEETEVVVTDDRVIYRDVSTGATGDLRWPWPQHLRVQPGNRDSGRSATVTQIQLVCAGPGGTFPALVLAGGDIATVGDADRLANVLRQTIARYRVEHAAELGIPAPQGRMLSRLVIGPEFSNYQGGEGQTVTLLGAISVQASQAVPRPRPIYGSAAVPAPVSAAPVYEPVAAAPEYAPVPAYEPAAAEWPVAVHAEFGTSPPQTLRPGFDADTASRPARPADDTVLRGAPTWRPAPPTWPPGWPTWWPAATTARVRPSPPTSPPTWAAPTTRPTAPSRSGAPRPGSPPTRPDPAVSTRGARPTTRSAPAPARSDQLAHPAAADAKHRPSATRTSCSS